jgi:DNA-binding transcriptional LysR family regulator
VLPALLAAFQQQQPAVTFRLQIANRATVQAALLAAHLDLALTGRPPDVPQVVAEPFLENPLVAIASPSHPLVQEQAISLARLAEEPFLLREEGSGTRAALEELFAEAGLPLHVSMVLGHVEAIKQAVTAGLGVSVLSALAIRREVRAGRLAVLAVEHFPIQRRWYITRLAGRDLSSSAQAFLAFLREHYQNTQDPVTL